MPTTKRSRKKTKPKPPAEEPLMKVAGKPHFAYAPAEEPTRVRTDSLWDIGNVAEEIEALWERPDELTLREAVATWMGPGRLGTLLDVGCGSARIAPMLSGWKSYTGIDGSAEMLRLAEGRAGDGTLIVHDLTQPLPFGEGEFDAVLCMNVLRHMDSYEEVLAEMRRVATKRAYIVDNFQEAAVHQLGVATVGGVSFVDNVWSLPRFLEAVARLFPGWSVTHKDLPYVKGVLISAS